MIRMDMQGRKLIFYDSQHSDLTATVQEESAGWRIEIQCPTLAPPNVIEIFYIPVLQEASKVASALNGVNRS